MVNLSLSVVCARMMGGPDLQTETTKQKVLFENPHDTMKPQIPLKYRPSERFRH
jgi:hypothetical protein